MQYPIYSPHKCMDNFEVLQDVNLQYGASFLSSRALVLTYICDVDFLFEHFVIVGNTSHVDFDDDLFCFYLQTLLNMPLVIELTLDIVCWKELSDIVSIARWVILEKLV